MRCDLNLVQDFKNDGILDEIKELSEKSRLLLAKGPAYQNNIKKCTCGKTCLEQRMNK